MLNVFIIFYFLILLALCNLFSRFNVKLICSFFLSFSLISCFNLLYYLITNYEQLYLINLGSWIDFDNLSIDRGFSIDSINIWNYMKNDLNFTHFISYLSLFIFFMIILFLTNNFIVIFLGLESKYNFILIKLINFLKIIILTC
jgi:NADH-quinone oxidoreductase subunit L